MFPNLVCHRCLDKSLQIRMRSFLPTLLGNDPLEPHGQGVSAAVGTSIRRLSIVEAHPDAFLLLVLEASRHEVVLNRVFILTFHYLLSNTFLSC